MDETKLRIGKVLLVAVCAMALAAGARAQGKIVMVDCTKNDSVSKALSTSASPLTIQISGICTEDVTISRSDVTLLGANPQHDGLRESEAADPGGDHSVLFVKDAARVFVTNLGIFDGKRFGLNVTDSYVSVSNGWFSNNDRAGVSLGWGGQMDLTDSEIDGPGRGVQVGDGGFTVCHHCTISVTGSQCAVLAIDGRLQVDRGSTVAAASCAVAAFDKASVFVLASAVSAPDLGAYADDASLISMTNSSLGGSIALEEHSVVELDTTTQTANSSGQNSADTSSIFQIARNSTVLGSVVLDRFSNLTLRNGSQIQGDLTCSAGGNAYCDDPSSISGATDACGLCVKP